MIVDLLKKNRSYRRFDTTRDISRELLLSFVESVRYTASGANLQRLRFTVINEKNALLDTSTAFFWGEFFQKRLKRTDKLGFNGENFLEKSSPVVANGNYIPHLKNFQKWLKE